VSDWPWPPTSRAELSEPCSTRKLLAVRQELAARYSPDAREKVSGSAAVLVLPAFRDLRPIDQEAFDKQWTEQRAGGAPAALEAANILEPTAPNCQRGACNATPDIQEVLCASISSRNCRNRSDGGRLRLAAARYESPTLLDQVITPSSRMDDRGLLSLPSAPTFATTSCRQREYLRPLQSLCPGQHRAGFAAWLNP
jgi:hypothetical protein